MYTERFTEIAELLAEIAPASYSTEQNTGYVSLANFHRAAVVIQCGALDDDVDVDVEEATSTAGAGAQSFDDGGKDTTLEDGTADGKTTVIEIRTEELDVNDDYDCINVELTPAGQACYFAVQVWGLIPRHAPVSTTGLNAVVD